jgi:hypothetical protein
MTDIRKLINQLGAQEQQLSEREFLAPCVRGGKVRTSLDKIIYTFTPEPRDFEGWGIFQPLDYKIAQLKDEPTLPQMAAYLQLLKPLRLRLVSPLQGQTWLGYPINESDMQQRFSKVTPVAVHLVTDGAVFEVIIARFDSSCWWFDEVDRRSDPQVIEQLRDFLRQETPPENIRFAGMTPEVITAYDLAWQQTPAGQQRRNTRQTAREVNSRPRRRQRHNFNNEERRIEQALRQGGGILDDFRDRGEFWQVEWRTRDGVSHTSAIAKNDLTVISSGICLSGRDRDFDLQSLVGVMERADEW